MTGHLVGLPGSSIAQAMTIRQIFDRDDRSVVYDQVKKISRVIIHELNAEAAKKKDAKPK